MDHSLRTFQAFPFEGKVARRYAATDEVSLDTRHIIGIAEKTSTFPPHPPRDARHLLLKEKAAHSATLHRPFPYRMQKALEPKRFGGFLHPLALLLCIQCTLACFCRRLRQSAIMAMNSEFVGLPLMFETV